MQILKSLGTLSLVIAVSAMIGCKGSDQPTDVLQEIPQAGDDGKLEAITPDDGSDTPRPDIEPMCEQNCGNRECGPDPVCKESCGTCDAPYSCNADGQCECEQECGDRVCGPDPVLKSPVAPAKLVIVVT